MKRLPIVVLLALLLVTVTVAAQAGAKAPVDDPDQYYWTKLADVGYTKADVKRLIHNPAFVSDVQNLMMTNFDTLKKKKAVGDTNTRFWSGTDDAFLDAIIQALANWLPEKGIFRPKL